MRSRLPLLTLLASALIVLAGLFLPWQGAYGFYLGCAGGAVAVLCSLGLRRRELLRRRPAPDLVAGILGIGLLASFLLPWVENRTGPTHHVGLPGIASAAAAVAALGVLLGAGRLLGSGRRFRFPFAVAVAVLTGGGASALALLATGGYGRWIGVGFVVALVAEEAFGARPLRLPALPSRGSLYARAQRCCCSSRSSCRGKSFALSPGIRRRTAGRRISARSQEASRCCSWRRRWCRHSRPMRVGPSS